MDRRYLKWAFYIGGGGVWFFLVMIMTYAVFRIFHF